MARSSKHIIKTTTGEWAIRPEPQGQALIQNMEEYRRKVTSDPAQAKAFLNRLGVLTKTGRVKTFIAK